MLASPMYTLGSWLNTGIKLQEMTAEYEKICENLVDCCKHEVSCRNNLFLDSSHTSGLAEHQIKILFL